MSNKEVFGFLSVVPESNDSRTEPLEPVQVGNVSFREVLRRRTVYNWNNNTLGSAAHIRASPFKMDGLVPDDLLVGRGHFFETLSGILSSTNYPLDPTGTAFSVNTQDFTKFRMTGVLGTVTSTQIPRVIGSLILSDVTSTTASQLAWGCGNSLFSLSDIPKTFTQIGTTYLHPNFLTGTTVSTSVGLSYVTFTGSSFFDMPRFVSGAWNLLRIHSGSDAGLYFVHHVDFQNNRLYLRCLDGTMFSAIATAAGLATTVGPGRRAFFNETSIIPLGTGTVQVGGRFVPGAARDSFIMRIVFDKTGSTEAAAATEQQGSYYVTMKPYTHGDGIAGTAQEDVAGPMSNFFPSQGTAFAPYNFQFFNGATNGYALDETNQRVWFGYTNSSNQSGIACWRWKTVEAFREISNYLGTAGHASYVSPSITLGAGDIIRSAHTGSDDKVYFIIGHATSGNGGVVVINPNLTTSQYRIAQGVPNSNLSGGALDKSRARSVAGTASTGSGTDVLTVTGGAFTGSDIGRAVVLSGFSSDNGTFIIDSVSSATQVVLRTTAGATPSFGGQSGGSITIGDRLYLFFNNGTTGAGLVNYMESLNPGTFRTRVVTMTNGSNCNVQIKNGEPCRIDVDQVTGEVYWLSNDTQQQINKYDPTSNTHSFRTIANVATPSGQTGTVGTITVFTAVKVNPKFDEVWVGTDQGHVKLVKSSFTGANFKRYFGNDAANYANPTGFPRGDGSPTSSFSSGQDSRHVRSYTVRADGRVIAANCGVSSTTIDISYYSREADVFVFADQASTESSSAFHYVTDSIGRWFFCTPSQNAAFRYGFGGFEIQYQWDNANTRWIPLEFAASNLPNKNVSDNFSPGLKSKPIHSAAEAVLYGVTVQFNRQGGATPPNNEFLGRAGQTGVARTDGSTTSGSATFNGSSFVSGDVGRILRIESGADAGIYKITVFTNSTTITISRMNGTAASASATASSLSYSIWDLGAVGSTAGPEDATTLLANGFSKDNTQDLTGISYESYQFKATFADNTDSIKFCTPVKIGSPKSNGSEVYFESFARTASQYQPALGQHRALPGSPLSAGDCLIDFAIDKVNNGTGSKPNTAPAHIWNGIFPASSVHGISPIVDLGADEDVGFVVVRITGNSIYAAATVSQHGMIANLFNDPDVGGTPVASSSVRTSGTSNLSGTINLTTVTLSSGDFIGSTVLGVNTDGSTVAGGSTFSAVASVFLSSHVGMILHISSGADVGFYRILSVPSGTSCTIQNLDQTAKQWSASASSLSYSVRDGVQPNDKIAIPNNSSPTYELCVERLLSSTSAQVRISPHATFSNQNWQVIRPSWNFVKRLSFSTDATPPDVKNNGTWMSADGTENYTNTSHKMYFDITDLSSTVRTGRYWRLVMQPRFDSGASSYTFTMTDIEFYSPSGARIGTCSYLFTDQAWSNTDFLSNHVHRVDFLQCSNSAVGGSFNGLATINSSGVVTLSGGNKFLGFQVRQGFTDGNPIAGGNTFVSSGAGFTTADVGRFLNVTSGANSGTIYRIVTRVSATQVTVALPGGTAVSFASTETGITFSLHEGIANGGSAPDVINFGAVDGSDEVTIASVNDALTQLTVLEAGTVVKTNIAFEIRRRGFDTTSATTDATKTARLVRPNSTYPVQTGDVAHDSRGSLRFFADDIGAAATRTGGSITGGSGVFTGTDFNQDDVGRILNITTGVNKGSYRISVFTSSTSVTLVHLITGAAVSLTADAGPVSYRLFGERRFRIAKYVYCLKA